MFRPHHPMLKYNLLKFFYNFGILFRRTISLKFLESM